MRHTSWIAILIFALAGLLAGNHASADVVTYSANLDGFQEVPPNASPGFGDADVTLDTVSGNINVTSGNYQDLLGNSSTIRLADAAIGSNGPTIMTLTLNGGGGVQNGTFIGTATLTAGQITDMQAGNMYLNLTTNVYPSGEIRGQLEAVPEPASLTILAGAGLLAIRRPTRRSLRSV